MFMRALRVLLLCSVTASVAAQDLAVYTDGLLNGFQDYSYGGGSNFANAAPFHNGAPSIAFTGNASFNAVSFYHATGTFAAGAYSGLRFFLNGGAAGGQQIYLMIESGGATVLPNPVLLTPYVAGGAIPAGAWAQVDVPFSALAFSNDGSFDRIDIQNANGTAQQTLYIDDVSLRAPAAATARNYIFGDSFEPEYLFVPQYTSSAINVYQRIGGNFTLLHSATLSSVGGSAISPNAISFASDGNLWVVDSDVNCNVNRLLRYTRDAIINNATAAPDVVDSLPSACSFDLQFFGGFAYVSQSDFGNTNRVLRYAQSSLNAGGAPANTALTNNALAVPAGLTFDAQGRLWISNYGNSSAVRMNNTSTGAVDVILSDTTVGNAPSRHALFGSESIAFDAYGTLWIGNNVEPTVSGYAATQLVSGNPTPVYQIDIAPALDQNDLHTDGTHPTGYVGGIAFDRHGDMHANYEYDYSVRGFTLTAAPSGGPYTSYTRSDLPILNSATTDPGRGGIAVWPRPSSIHIQ